MLVIRDSFDFYSTASDGAAGFWDLFAPKSLSKTVTRMGAGQSLYSPSGGTYTALSKTFSPADKTIFIAFAMRSENYLSRDPANSMQDCWWVLKDGTTVQVTICFSSDGSLQIYRGDGATLLANYPYSSPGAVWTHWQIKVVIDGVNGEVHIRKNGNPVDDFAVVGVNTKASSNASVNAVSLVLGRSSGYSIDRAIDDLAIYTGTGGAPWNDWIGDCRAVQVMPVSDTAQRQFTPNTTTAVLGNLINPGSFGANGNQLWCIPVTSTNGGQLDTSVVVSVSGGLTGRMKVALYDADGPGVRPGTLLSSSNEITNPVSGANTFTLSNPPIIKANHTYFWCVWASANYTLYGTGQANQPNYNYSAPYSSSGSFPTSLSAYVSVNTYSNQPPTIHASVAVTNSGSVNDLTTDGSASYVSDSNVGDYDLYTLDALKKQPTAVLGVTLRGFVAKSDSGTRIGALTLKSGSTSADSPGLVLSTSFNNILWQQDTDPNTGVAWTAAALSTLQIGPKVAQ